jgi:lactoylglutathione lyase
VGDVTRSAVPPFPPSNVYSVHMTDWPGGIFAITVFAEDIDASKTFYRDVFEAPLVFEDDVSAVFRFGGTMLNLLAAPQAPTLIEPAVPGGPDAGQRHLYTLQVDDVDAKAAELQQKGVTLLNGPQDRAWGIRTAAFADPTGTIWELSAPLESD